MVLVPPPLPPLPPLTDQMEFAVRSTLEWRRDGKDWVLFHQQKGGRWQAMGKVSPDPDWPNMFRSPMSRGRMSDMANLTWAKNAVFEDALRDLIWAHRDQLRRTPTLILSN